MEPFTETDDPDVVMESHGHWAVGHVDGFIRVFRDGEITEAFKAYHELSEQLADYPILDEEDYSERELEATLENINDAAWRVKDEYKLPEGWESEVYSWLSDHRQGASRTVTIKVVTRKKTTFGRRLMPWDTSRLKSDTPAEGVMNATLKRHLRKRLEPSFWIGGGNILGTAGCLLCGIQMLPNEICVVLGLGQTDAGTGQDFTSQTQFFSNRCDIAFQAPATIAVILAKCSEFQSLFEDEQPEPIKDIHA